MNGCIPSEKLIFEVTGISLVLVGEECDQAQLREIFCCGSYMLSGSNKKLATARPIRKLPWLQRDAWSGVQEGQIGGGGAQKT